jgi:hypothetical protein
MAIVLRHDGANDYLTISNTVNFVSGDTLEFKFRILTNQTFAWISNGPTSVSAYVRWNGSTLRARGTQTGPAVSPPAGINLADGEFHTVQLILSATTHKFNVDGTDTADLTGNVSTSMFNTLSAFFNSYFDGDLEYIKIFNSGGTKFNWDANSSSTGPGATVLTETVAGNDATGVGFPTDGSQWIDTGGAGITVPVSVTNQVYNALNATIVTTGEINIPASVTNQSYTSLDHTISFTGQVDIPVSATNQVYTAQDVNLSLVGDIEVPVNTTSMSYTANDSTIVLTPVGVVIVPAQQTNMSYEAIDVNLTLQGEIQVDVATTNYTYNAIDSTIRLSGPLPINPRNTIKIGRDTNRIMVKRRNNTIRV